MEISFFDESDERRQRPLTTFGKEKGSTAEFIGRPAIIKMKDSRSGETDQALTFLVVDKKGETAPPDCYKQEILRGAETVVSKEYLESLQDLLNSLSV